MRRLAALALLALIILLLGIAQLVLPGVAARQLRDRLAKHGSVISVQVSAFPAVMLLWHRADKVVVRLRSYRSSSSGLGQSLAQAADAGSVDASVGELDTGLLTLHDAVLRKRGDRLTGRASVTEAGIRYAVPFLDSVQPIASAAGTLTLRGTATILGVTASVDATVRAVNGRLVVVPEVPFGTLATVTLFSTPHLDVTGVGARPTPDGFTVTATARMK